MYALVLLVILLSLNFLFPPNTVKQLGWVHFHPTHVVFFFFSVFVYQFCCKCFSMGKKGSSTSWLTAVKRAFRSPTKDTDKKSSRTREDYDHEEDEEKVNSIIFYPSIFHPFTFSFSSHIFLFAEERKTKMDFQKTCES